MKKAIRQSLTERGIIQSELERPVRGGKRFSSDYQPAQENRGGGVGRPARIIADAATWRATQIITKRDCKRLKLSMTFVGMTWGTGLARTMIEKGMAGDVAAAALIMDRIEGKPQQRVEMVGAYDAPPVQVSAYRALTMEELEQLERIARAAALREGETIDVTPEQSGPSKQNT